jgi:hypothetical protein
VTDDHVRRLQAAFLRRERAARRQLLQSTYCVDEGDTDGDDGPITNYGKALAHRDDGVPTASAYASPVDAGADPDATATWHIVTGRDLTNTVRRQVPYLATRDAAEVLLEMGVPFDRRIPYRQGETGSATAGTPGIRTAAPIINFGAHDVLESVVSVFDLAQTAASDRRSTRGDSNPNAGRGWPVRPARQPPRVGGTTTTRATRLAPVTGVSTALGATADAIAAARSATLTVNDELNKLATNVALGRNWAGIHYRSDGVEGLLLGEQVAVRHLQDHLRATDLPFDGYRLEPFFDAYLGVAEGAAPNHGRDAILLTPDRITTPTTSRVPSTWLIRRGEGQASWIASPRLSRSAIRKVCSPSRRVGVCAAR